MSREVIVLPAFMASVAAWGLIHFSGWNPTLYVIAGTYDVDLCAANGWRRDRALFCTVPVHRHDLRLYEDAAGMGDTADGS